MAKLIPLSVVLVSIIVPMLFADKARPKAKLRFVLLVVIGYILVWTQLCLRVYPEYVPLE
jgi:hypothetical protein